MSLRVITQPTELITAEEAANFMRIDSPDATETAIIEAMITAARQWCEEYLRRAIGQQTLELALDSFPLYGKRSIVIRSPVVSLTSVKYLDTSNVEQTLTLNTDFFLADDCDPAEVRPYSAWPAALNITNAVKVRFVAGYQNDESPVTSVVLPQTIRQAILMQVADLYEHRNAQLERQLTANPTLERLLSMYRLEMGI